MDQKSSSFVESLKWMLLLFVLVLSVIGLCCDSYVIAISLGTTSGSLTNLVYNETFNSFATLNLVGLILSLGLGIIDTIIFFVLKKGQSQARKWFLILGICNIAFSVVSILLFYFAAKRGLEGLVTSI